MDWLTFEEIESRGLWEWLNGIRQELRKSIRGSFAPTVFWQDQRNSPVKYRSNGYVDYTSCGEGHSLDNPCANPDPTIVPGMILQASPKLQLYGLIYRPRGAGIEFKGHGHIRAPLQVITGSVSLQGGPTLELLEVQNPLRRRVVALVE